MRKRVVVVGGGTMGAGIAQSLLEAEALVVLVENDHEKVAAAFSRVEKGLRQRYKREADTEVYVAESAGRLTMSVGLPEGVEADLVVEAVFEDPKLKSEILAK